MSGDEKAMWFALGQIHRKSLEARASYSAPNDQNCIKSYKETLLNQATGPQHKVVQTKRRAPVYSSNTVYLSGLSDDTKLKDLWILFRKEVTLKDIILPRLKGKKGNKFGFVITENVNQAAALITKFHKKTFHNSTLYLDFAKSSKGLAAKRDLKAEVSRERKGPSNLDMIIRKCISSHKNSFLVSINIFRIKR